jgi:carbon-monoxide dehydrogenase medium subunit
VALDGRFHLRNQTVERWVSAGEFFVGLFTTLMDPAELLVEVALPPMPARSGWSLMEVARRPHDFALVGVAVAVSLDAKGLCDRARMVFLSVGDSPMAAHKAADSLKGQAPTADAIRAAAQLAASEDIDPGGDIHATAAFRRHLASVLGRRALEQAFKRAADIG